MTVRPQIARPVLAGLLVVAVAVSGVGPAMAQQPPVPSGSPQELRDTVDEVLSRREFQRPEPTWLERAQDWVGERISSLFETLTGGGAGSLVGWLVLGVAIGALVWALTRLGGSVQRDPTASATVRIDQGRTPGEWLSEAERLEAGGAWKEALRSRYRALLGELVRAQIIEDVPGLTTGEYRREVTVDLPDAADAFTEITDLFEGAWYADQPTGPSESERFRAAADVVVTRAQSGERAPATVGAG